MNSNFSVHFCSPSMTLTEGSPPTKGLAIRKTKYKHVFCKFQNQSYLKIENRYLYHLCTVYTVLNLGDPPKVSFSNLRLSLATGDQAFIKCNSSYFATGLEVRKMLFEYLIYLYAFFLFK
jgi:hypothetical protein